MKFLLLWMLLLAASAAAQTTAQFDGIPDVTFQYYDLPGRTPAAIHAAMLKLRPTDTNDGQRVDALSNWSWRWSWQGIPGRCDLAGARLSFSAKVQMPRLADRSIVPTEVLARWDSYIAALERHEAWHVRNGYAGEAEIRTAIKDATCATANAAAMAAAKRIGARDIDYDRRTHHGSSEGTPF